MPGVSINGIPVLTGGMPYVLAEVSCSHCGSLDRAHRLIDMAADAKADGVKFQLYGPDDMADPDAPPLTEGPWTGRTLYDLYNEAQTPGDWMPELSIHARDRGLGFVVTVFQPRDVRYLEPYVDALKIASAEIGWKDLLTTASLTGLPLIVSTGMATHQEVEHAAMYADVLLHCVSGYPTPPEAANLTRMLGFMDYPGVEVGLSDHSRTAVVPCVAVGLGAALVEVHIKSDEGPTSLDDAWSWGPEEFAGLVTGIRTSYWMMCNPSGDVERASRQFKRREINGRWLRG